VEKDDGITVYVPKEAILKEIVTKIEFNVHISDLIQATMFFNWEVTSTASI
jgi:hypothetical protein